MISKIIYESIKQKKFKIKLENKEGCCICGINNAMGWFIKKDILSKSFTDYTFMKNKNSKWICFYCKELFKTTKVAILFSNYACRK